MPYYCTVPQCTSLAGKAKDVSFHQFPRDEALGARWNKILLRNKPYTKYSKVCSRHFTASDYTMTNMGKNKGQWKTLNKDAIPSQNLPKINPDGSVMVIRKGRSPKYKEEDPNCSMEENPSLGSMAKDFLAGSSGGSVKNESQSPWYSPDDEQDGEGDAEDEEEDVKDVDVKVKQEYPPKKKVQTQDATIQTDLCQEGIGFRKSLLDPCQGFGFFPQSIGDSTGMTNYFQTSTTEHLSLPKEPLTMAQGQCVLPPFYTEAYPSALLGDSTNRKH